MKIEFYVGTPSESTRMGNHHVLDQVVKVSGYLDEELGFLKLRIFLKQGRHTSSLTAAICAFAVNKVFEKHPDIPVKSVSIDSQDEVPEWA